MRDCGRILRTLLFLLLFHQVPFALAGDPEGQVLPTGMRITPLAARDAVLEPLNPGLPTLPNFVASIAVASAVSPTATHCWLSRLATTRTTTRTATPSLRLPANVSLAGRRDLDAHDGPEDDAGTGCLWDAALRAQLTVRNYGFEFIDETRSFLDPSDPSLIPPMRSPFKAGVIVSRATKPSLMPNTDPYYLDWDYGHP